MAAPQANMEEILSSIRSTLEEETSRGSTGDASNAPDDDVLMLDEELTDEELLALSEADGPVMAVNANSDFIDLTAFTSSGEVKASAPPVPNSDDVLGIKLDETPNEPPVAPPATEEVAVVASEEMPAEAADVDDISAAGIEVEAEAEIGTPVTVGEEPAASPDVDDAFDKLMNEIKQEQSVSHEEKVANLLGDEEPLDDVDGLTAHDPEVAEDVAETVAIPVPMSAAVPKVTQRMQVEAIAGASGLQVALPAEVLAEALRPLIRDWLNENLAPLTERLIQEEISKLTSQ